MKKILRTAIITVMALSLILCFTGCGKVEYEPIGQKVFLDEDCVSGLMYSDGETMLTSFGRKTASGNGMKTRGFALYDKKSGDLINAGSIVSSYQVTSAVPEENGIIYVNYTKDEDKTINWSVIELKEGAYNYILSGKCKNTSELPVLLKSEEGTMIVWKDRASSVAGLSVLSEGELSRLMNEESSHLVNTKSDSNGSYVAVYTIDDDKNRTISLVDAEGNVKKIPIDGKLQDVAVTKDNVLAVIRQGESPARYKLFNYVISKDEASYTEISACLYGLSGGDGNAALCHDLDNNVYVIDAEKSELKKIEIPEGLEGAEPVFGRIIKNKAVVAFSLNEVSSFYEMDIK